MIGVMKADQVERTRGRTSKWVAGGLAAAVAAAGIATWASSAAAADPTLPPLTASELLNRVATSDVAAMSATFTQRSDLGLPALPAGLGDSGDELQTALNMLTGEHTIRVWTNGPQRSRVSLVDADKESSVIRNGDQLWTWSSDKQKVGHAKLDGKSPAPRPSGTPRTPAETVDRLLKAVGPSTEVSTSGTGYVAGRSVYQLILAPRDNASLVGQVRLSIDSVTFVPLGLRVIDRGGAEAMSLTASAVDFNAPDDSVFSFTPPPGSEVTELDHKSSERPSGKPSTGNAPKTYGTGWATVTVVNVGTKQATDPAARALLNSLPAVSGAWGSGRLLSTSLVNVVITDDGRIAAGSVTADRLYAALANR